MARWLLFVGCCVLSVVFPVVDSSLLVVCCLLFVVGCVIRVDCWLSLVAC